MKKRSFRFPTVLLAVMVLVANSIACGGFPRLQPGRDQPEPAAPNLEQPVDASSGSGADPNMVIPCVQLIPPDEIQPLLNNIASSNPSENVYPGGSICSWQYTPNGGSEPRLFYLEATFGPDSPAAWEIKRQYELTQEPADILVNSIDGLGDENYVWSSKVTVFYVVFARKGDKALILRYIPQDVLYMANESGIIDMVDRFFNRF